MSRSTVVIDWPFRMDVTTAPLSPEQAAGVAYFRELKKPPKTYHDAAVMDLIARGAPRLALARALGIMFAPIVLGASQMGSTNGTSRTSSMMMDTIVERLHCRIIAADGLTSRSWLEEPEDFDAIGVHFKVGGPNGYNLNAGFTPLAATVESFNAAIGAAKTMPNGMVLKQGQWIEAQVRPVEAVRGTVSFVWRAWQPAEHLAGPIMKLSEEGVLGALEECGYEVPRVS